MSKQFHKNRLFTMLGIDNRSNLLSISKQMNICPSSLEYYNDNMILPLGDDLERIIAFTDLSELEIKLRLGVLDNNLIEWISRNPEIIINSYREEKNVIQKDSVSAEYATDLGKLYRADCMHVMNTIPNDSIDMIFADPPFNLDKKYESGMNDSLSEQQYLEWTEKWLRECARILTPGGTLFVYNIPYWATYTANILNKYLNFRHWIAIYMRGLMPIHKKLNPSHYGLLYYIKGDKPKVFNQQRIPMSTCRHCGGEIHDYGGKKRGLDPRGLSVADIWTDINPVRHQKFKNRTSNELPLKLLYRVISLSTNEGDVVFDPFGGSGTTYAVAEYLKRKWIGAEIGDVKCIIERLIEKTDSKRLIDIEKENAVLFTESQVALRKKNKYWSYDILDANNKGI